MPLDFPPATPGQTYTSPDGTTEWIFDGVKWTGSTGAGGTPPLTQPQADARYLQLSGAAPMTGSLQISPPSTAPNQFFFTPVNPGVADTPQGSQFNSYLVSQTTGGNFYDMYCNIRADTAIQGSGSTGITGILSQMTYNGNGGSGGYVPVYGQMNRRTVNAGGSAQNPSIWGGVFEVNDFTNTDSAGTNYMSGIEIDMTVGNTDSANMRRALGIYLNKANTTDANPVCNLGVHVAANVGTYNYMLKFHGGYNNAVIDLTEATTTLPTAAAIWLPTGTIGAIAFDTNASLRVYGDGVGGMVMVGAASQPARIIFSPGSGAKSWWVGGWEDSGFYIADNTASVTRISITTAGAISLNGPTQVNGYLAATGSIGVNGTSPPVSKPTVTGSKGGNAALASLITALAGYGLITDSTS